MRRVGTIQKIFVVAICASGLLGGSLVAQDGKADGTAPRGGQARRFSTFVDPQLGLGPVVPGMHAGSAVVLPAYPAYPYAAYPYPYAYAGGYYWGVPWYVPQTRKYKSPAPIYEFPKLGLQHMYPHAQQFGFDVPPETDEPISTGAATEEWTGGVEVMEGIALLRKGRFADAGRLFARGLGDEAAPPELYLLIAEALWGAGKPKDADIVLRQAIDVARTFEFLDRADLPGKFPSREVLDGKLADLGNAPALIHGTLLILAGKKDEGLAILREVADGDTAARRVYLHYVASAFGAAEEKAPPAAGAEGKKPAGKPEAPPPPPPAPAPGTPGGEKSQ
jgi:hypothetical protein